MTDVLQTHRVVLDIAWMEMLWRYGTLLGERYHPAGLRSWPPPREDPAPAAAAAPAASAAPAAHAEDVAYPRQSTAASSSSAAAGPPPADAAPLPPLAA
eukprot:8260867-Alexandrium_andersonii.AAC.1